MANDYLLVIADRKPLAWILTEERMAFPSVRRAKLVGRLSPGDRLFLYTSRGCFHNPTRDRGRVIGEAIVTSKVAVLAEPIKFDDHVYPLGCSIHIKDLAPRGAGLDVAMMLEKLHLFPDSHTWSIQLRRVLVPLDKHDASLFAKELAAVVKPPDTYRAEYLQRSLRRLAQRSVPLNHRDIVLLARGCDRSDSTRRHAVSLAGDSRHASEQPRQLSQTAPFAVAASVRLPRQPGREVDGANC